MVSEQCCRSCLKSETKNEPHMSSSGFQRSTCTTTKAPVLFWSTQNVEYATKRMIKGTSHLSLSVKALLLSRTGYFHYNPIKRIMLCLWGTCIYGSQKTGMAHRTFNQPHESKSLNYRCPAS